MTGPGVRSRTACARFFDRGLWWWQGGTATAGPAQKGGELTVALAEDPDALDPSTARTFVGRIVFANTCEKLYDTKEKLEVVPQLATELPTLSDGGVPDPERLRSRRRIVLEGDTQARWTRRPGASSARAARSSTSRRQSPPTSSRSSRT